MLVDHGSAGGGIGHPSWTADGSSIYASVAGSSGETSIVRIAVANGSATTVVRNGSQPICSPDGQTLIFLRRGQDETSTEIWRSALDGSGREPGQRRPVLDIESPAISPDGRTLALLGSDHPGSANHGRMALDPRHRPAIRVRSWQDLGDLDPSVARGHRHRLTSIKENRPTVAWSPDGKQITASADLGLYLIDLDHHRTYLIKQNAGIGLNWVR